MIYKDIDLYNKVKKLADVIYKKNSAYKSGFIVKKYKEMGGQFYDNDEKPLKNWFKERWYDINDNKGYPVYRPLIKVNNKTPLTVNEIDKDNLIKQIKLKQKIKGSKNLPPFIKK